MCAFFYVSASACIHTLYKYIWIKIPITRIEKKERSRRTYTLNRRQNHKNSIHQWRFWILFRLCCLCSPSPSLSLSHSLSCVTIFIPSCTGFQFPINRQQICVLCVQFAYREISIHTHIIYISIDRDMYTDTYLILKARLIHHHESIQLPYFLPAPIVCLVCATRKSVLITDTIQGARWRNTPNCYHDLENRRLTKMNGEERKTGKVYTDTLPKKQKAACEWCTFLYIDFFNHIVNAKKIIIQDEWYWVTIWARAICTFCCVYLVDWRWGIPTHTQRDIHITHIPNFNGTSESIKYWEMYINTHTHTQTEIFIRIGYIFSSS